MGDSSSSDLRRPIVVLVTASVAEAAELARTLVEERLAACVNRVAVSSTYRWKESVETEDETLLIIKTADDRAAALEKRIQELHSYDVPEFVVLEPGAVADTYLDWLLGATADSQ